MAVLSPALVVAMCVMFLLTRLHRHYYIFEHPFLFGLKYCLEPLQTDIDTIVSATSSSKPPHPAHSGKNKSKTKPPPTTSKQKTSASILPVRRMKLNEQFFSTESEFPHHRQFDHLMAIFCGYFASYVFEETVHCVYPNMLANKRSVYVAVFGIGFSILEALRISVDMTDRRAMFMLGGISWLIAMFLISAGDSSTFLRFEDAFSGLGKFAVFIFTTRLKVEEQKALAYAKTFTIITRFFIATTAALISASVAVPARHFSKLDYALHKEYREEEGAHDEDPYYLGRPTAFTMLKIALDYIIPALTVFFWLVSPRGEGSYGPWRLVALLASVFCRFANLRIRLQMYLDGAIHAYRAFWADKSATNVREAARQTSMQVIGNSYFLLTIAMAYIAPTLIPLLLTFVAKLDGGVTFGICPLQFSLVPQPNEVFAREIAAFLAWWSLASYVTFACISFAYEAAADLLNPGGRERQRVKLPPASTSSERRKHKRMMQQRVPSLG